MNMFCYQCQEAAKGTGCTLRGVCGKTNDVSNLQDLLIYVLKGISIYGMRLKNAGINTPEADNFIVESLFATVTNVNFDREYFIERIKQALNVREQLKEQAIQAGVEPDENLHDSAVWTAETAEDFEAKAKSVGILADDNEDIRSLKSIILYGVKGMAAYAYHAHVLGYDDQEVYHFMQKALAATADSSLNSDELLALVMETGKYAVQTMALLDKANTSTYGNPEITRVNIGVRNNPGILISGHDLKDMEELLKQTEGTGVDVYTHGEMLPAHYYPAFKKYEHFAGNYGNAWWKQDKEFQSFNGPILMTTNCLVPPKDSYKDRLYTTGVVGFPGIKHIPVKEDGTKDFTEIIEHARRCAPPEELERGEIVGGFAHSTVLGLADKVVEAVKSGKIDL